MLRVVQLGLKVSDLDNLEYGFVLDMLTETQNDEYKYRELPTQTDYDRF